MYLCVSFIILKPSLLYLNIFKQEESVSEEAAKNGESEDYFSCRRIAYIAVDIVFIHHHVPGDSGRRFQYAAFENSFFEESLQTD